MTLLAVGVLLFTLVHLALAIAPEFADGAKSRFGEGAVKGVVSVLSLAGIVLIVLGWRSAQAHTIYAPAYEWRIYASLLVVFGLYLMVVASRASVLKRRIRHPQLTGLLLWAVAHLLMNGDSRSVVLFGGLGCWAVLEILLINRRDRNWIEPGAPGLPVEAVNVIITLAVTALLVWAHPWIAGVPVLSS